MKILGITVAPFAVLGIGIGLIRDGMGIAGYPLAGIGCLGIVWLLWMYSWFKDFKM